MKYLLNNQAAVRFISLVVLLVIGFSFSTMVQAEVDLKGPLEKAGKGIYGEEVPAADSLPAMIGGVIRVVLSLVGIIMVVIIVYAGFTWMTGGGEPDKIKSAKSWMLNAVVGLLICLLAYTLSAFVIDKIFEATTSTTPTPTP